MSLIYFPIIVSVFAMAFAWFLNSRNKKDPAAAQEDALSYWKKKYGASGIAGIVLFIILLFVGWQIAIGFLIGVLLLGISAFVCSNKKGLIAGFTVVSLGLLAVSGYYFFIQDLAGLIGLLLGAGLVAISVRNVSADIFETYVISIVGTMLLGAFLFSRSIQFVLLPLILASVSILALIIGSFFAKQWKSIAAVIILSVIAFYLVISKLMPNPAIPAYKLFLSVLVGLLIPLRTLISSKYHKLEKSVPIRLIVAGAVLGLWLAGMYGIALVALGTLLVSGIAIALISAGGETKAIAKNYSIVSATLASLVLFFVYSEQVLTRGISIYNLDYARVIAGILIGAIASSLFVMSLAAKKNKRFLFPLLIIILAPVLVGFILGPQALGGLLIGVIITGFLTLHNELAMNSLIKGVCIVALLIFSFIV